MDWDQQQAENWLHWWHQGYWQLADDSWSDSEFFALPSAQQHLLAWQQPLAVAASFGIPPALPPEPASRLLTLIALPGEHWQVLLALVAGICAPQSAPPGLSPTNRIWCRRLAKALRCDNWLSNDCFQPYAAGSLILLRCLCPDSWPRLRLLFPKPWVTEAERHPSVILPASRLATLWDAAIWQSQQTESMSHVDHQENHPVE